MEENGPDEVILTGNNSDLHESTLTVLHQDGTTNWPTKLARGESPGLEVSLYLLYSKHTAKSGRPVGVPVERKVLA